MRRNRSSISAAVCLGAPGPCARMSDVITPAGIRAERNLRLEECKRRTCEWRHIGRIVRRFRGLRRNPVPYGLIRCTELTKRFGTLTAVDAVSFEIAQGEVCSVLGPNGAGKSTLIRMLCGLTVPDAGTA